MVAESSLFASHETRVLKAHQREVCTLRILHKSPRLLIVPLHTCRASEQLNAVQQVNSVAWSCNGKRLATGSSDGCIKIWQPILRITVVH